jgi:hypothetical protein
VEYRKKSIDHESPSNEPHLWPAKYEVQHQFNIVAIALDFDIVKESKLVSAQLKSPTSRTALAMVSGVPMYCCTTGSAKFWAIAETLAWQA